jgi:ureidoglycolate lyase
MDMRKISAQRLTYESFKTFGTFADMINPNTTKIGDKPVEFFRDMLQIRLGQSTTASISTCCIEKRETLIDCIEFHSSTCEGFMPLDGDVLVHVAPASPNGQIPPDEMQAFIIPKYTFVMMSPGVWHYAPFPIEKEYVHTLVILPERTYANDCIVVNLTKEESIMIEGY